MDFRPNKIAVEIIKQEAFGGSYFRDIYCSEIIIYGKELLVHLWAN